MLSVGREINIETKNLLCRKCAWQGRGAQLSTGLVRLSRSEIYVYAYRCPQCGSFDVASKGKLLAFRPRVATALADTNQRTANDENHSVESRRRKLKRLWQ
jgi:predicted Rdx family selenoprotein